MISPGPLALVATEVRLFQGDRTSPFFFGEATEQKRGRLHIACAACYPPPLVDGQRSLHILLEDDPSVDWLSVPDWAAGVSKAARIGTRALRAGFPVLTSCRAGLNRSGLLSALILCQLGLDPKDAIDAVRESRSIRALSNYRFVEAIYALGEGTGGA